MYIEVENIEQAELLSKLVFRLCCKEGAEIQSKYLFPFFEHEGKAIIEVEDMVLKIRERTDFEDTLNQLAAILNGALTQAEAVRIGTALRDGEVNLLDLVPDSLQEIEITFTKKSII